MTGTAAIAAVPAAAIGAGLAVVLIPGGAQETVSSRTSWVLAAAAGGAALAGAPLMAAWRYRRPAQAANQPWITGTETGRPPRPWRRPVRGVRHVAAVWDTTWVMPFGQPVTVIAADPASYAALVADTPFPALPAAALRAAPDGVLSRGAAVPVLASPAAAAVLGSGTTQLNSLYPVGPLTVRVAGILAATPAQPGGGSFVVMPLERLPGPAGQPCPTGSW
ncbi:MAG: hypothetical protein ACRDOU_32430 [Streptosporangiaceae bacterium]